MKSNSASARVYQILTDKYVPDSANISMTDLDDVVKNIAVSADAHVVRDTRRMKFLTRGLVLILLAGTFALGFSYILRSTTFTGVVRDINFSLGVAFVAASGLILVNEWINKARDERQRLRIILECRVDLQLYCEEFKSLRQEALAAVDLNETNQADMRNELLLQLFLKIEGTQYEITHLTEKQNRMDKLIG